MGREPLPLRIPPLTPERCRSVVLCGISTCFQVLSPSKGQVAHALLTRSPLNHQPKSMVPFDLHVLGTPPAFVLSQDQTLVFNLYGCLPASSLPGSRSPAAAAHFPSLGRLQSPALRSPDSSRRLRSPWLLFLALYSFQGAPAAPIRGFCAPFDCSLCIVAKGGTKHNVTATPFSVSISCYSDSPLLLFMVRISIHLFFVDSRFFVPF